MGFENLNPDDNTPETVVVPEESGSNRTFLLIAAALGAIAVLALGCIAAYAFVVLPRTRAQQDAYAQTQAAQRTEVERIVAMTATSDQATAIAQAWTATPTRTPIPPTPTPTSSPTPVVAVATGDAAAPSPGPDDATATALHATLDANATLYVATLTAAPGALTATPTSAMPNSGFADEVGLPAMLGMAALLILVIFLARRLRSA